MSKIYDFRTGLLLDGGQSNLKIDKAQVQARNERSVLIANQIFNIAIQGGFDPTKATIVFGDPEDVGGLMICSIDQSSKVTETLYRLHSASLNLQTLLDRAALDFVYDPDHIEIRDFIDEDFIDE